MDSATASMDFTSLVKDTLKKHRNEWLAHCRLHRGLIGAAFPFEEDATFDLARWSAKTVKKALEWATFNPGSGTPGLVVAAHLPAAYRHVLWCAPGLAGLFELPRENAEIGRYRRAKLIAYVTREYGVND